MLQLSVTDSAMQETIILELHGTIHNGSLVISDGRGDQLLTVNARRASALIRAFIQLAEELHPNNYRRVLQQAADDLAGCGEITAHTWDAIHQVLGVEYAPLLEFDDAPHE